jgi:arylsulfatase A-like enzyme
MSGAARRFTSTMKLLATFLSTFVILVSSFAAPPRPNIILIYTDDHGHADLGIHGVVKDIKTPNLDALARSGVVATHGYSTAPQCVPSRGGVMTGRFQGRFDLDNNGSALDGFNKQTTIATRLQNAGYATAQFGKWHLGPTEAITKHGFKHVFSQNAQRPFSANITLDGQDRPMSDLPPIRVSPRRLLEGRRSDHRALQGPALLPLRGLSRPAHAAGRAKALHGPLSRRDAGATPRRAGHAFGHRRRRGPHHEHFEKTRPHREDAHLLHRRQRRSAEDPQGRFAAPGRRRRLGRQPEHAAEWRKRHALRRRHVHAVSHRLARHDPRRAGLRASRECARRGRHGSWSPAFRRL